MIRKKHHNAYDSLSLSKKLYGREKQIQQLNESFSQISSGDTQLLLVSGYSGIGKSSLVNELRMPIKLKNGYFIKGKYDQFQRTTPYSAVIEAFRDLISRMLVEPNTNIESLRQIWLASLGNNGKIIVDVIPEIVNIIGPQPPVANLSPAESQNRFMLTMCGFIRSIAHPDHPLVLFLDDLQWIDSASLQLINSLLSDYDLRHFLLIGAYRDNEVSVDHPLSMALDKINNIGIPINRIILTSLTQIDLENFLADSFNCDTFQVKSLAASLLEKTYGNPFFINQILKVLYQNKLLKFIEKKQELLWDASNSEINLITENIISLLTFRIHQLPDKAQSLLKLASCIGHIFDLNTLATINELSVSDTRETLSEAISLNLVVPLDRNLQPAYGHKKSKHLKVHRYQFIHDHIQHAAYSLIEEDIRKQIHLQIGRMILKNHILNEHDDNLFDIVNHFIEGLSLITDQNERQKIAQYCLWAGRKSKSASAYQAAKHYLQTGYQLIDDIRSESYNNIAFSISKELAVCKYLLGDFDEAELDFHDLIDCARNLTDKLECYKLYCEMLSTLNRHADALKHGLIALKMTGYHLPAKPNLIHVLYAILKIKYQVGWRRVQNINLLPVNNSEHRAVIDLISQMFNSAFIVNQDLFLLLTCTNVFISLRHGYADSTSFACVVYAFILMHALNRYHEGINYVEFYNHLTQIHFTSSLAGKNYFVLGSFIDPYRYPLESTFETISKAYQYSYEAGDLAYSNYCNILLVITSQMAGKPISVVEKYVNASLSFVNRIKTSDFRGLINFNQYAIQCLTQTDIDDEAIKQYERDVIENKNMTETAFFYSGVTRLFGILGLYDEAKEYGKKHANHELYALGMVSVLTGSFYYALAICIPEKTVNSLSSQHKKEVNKILKRINRWTKWCPVNFKHYYFLLKAEHSRLHNKQQLTLDYYHAAIDMASSQDVLDVLAIANERLSYFYQQLNLLDMAEIHIQKSYDAYYQLGAIKQCQYFENHYPKWIKQTLIIKRKDTFKNTNLSLIDKD